MSYEKTLQQQEGTNDPEGTSFIAQEVDELVNALDEFVSRFGDGIVDPFAEYRPDNWVLKDGEAIELTKMGSFPFKERINAGKIGRVEEVTVNFPAGLLAEMSKLRVSLTFKGDPEAGRIGHLVFRKDITSSVVFRKDGAVDYSVRYFDVRLGQLRGKEGTLSGDEVLDLKAQLEYMMLITEQDYIDPFADLPMVE